MNQCIITGNLGADPETFYSADGSPIATFNLAFRMTREKTGWVKVVCFQKQAEIAATYLHKGAKVLLSASLDQSRWEGESGEQKTSIQLIAQRIEFIKTDGRGFDSKGEDAPF